MLNRLPKHMPHLSTMLGDIGEPSNAELAGALGVSARTVQRWRTADEAPLPVMLTIFWLTRWGQSAVDAEATNSARMHASIAIALQREVDRLHAQLAWLTSVADFGSANAPTIENHRPSPRLVLVHPPGEPAAAQPASLEETARATTGNP